MPLVLMPTIADALNAIMREKHINQRQLAAYLDVSPQAVSEWVKGSRVPEPKFVWKIAELTRRPVEEVMRDAGHLPPRADEPREVPESVLRVFRELLEDEERLDRWLEFGKFQVRRMHGEEE